LLVALDDNISREKADLGTILRDDLASLVPVAISEVVKVEPLRQGYRTTVGAHRIDVALLRLQPAERTAVRSRRWPRTRRNDGSNDVLVTTSARRSTDKG
jgi:hypothetical protein